MRAKLCIERGEGGKLYIYISQPLFSFIIVVSTLGRERERERERDRTMFDDLALELGCKVGNMTSPYLGLPLEAL